MLLNEKYRDGMVKLYKNFNFFKITAIFGHVGDPNNAVSIFFANFH